MVNDKPFSRTTAAAILRSTGEQALADIKEAHDLADRFERAGFDLGRLVADQPRTIEIGLSPGVLRKLRQQMRRMDKQRAKEGQMSSRPDTYVATLQEVLGKAFDQFAHPAGEPIHLTLHCVEGHTVEWTSPNRIPPGAIASKLKRMGWRLGRHPKCPEHTGHGAKKERVMPGVSNPPKLAAVPSPPTPAEATEAARFAKRLVLADLEAYLDEQNRRYKPGHSDATIANEHGVAEAVVKNLRVEFYGDLREPTEIEGLREELAMAEQTAGELQGQVDSLKSFIAGVRGRIDHLVQKNGWRS